MQPGLAHDFERYFQSCCVVVSSGGGDGTGFFVAPGMVLTNRHVVDGYAQVHVRDGAQTWPAKVVPSSNGADLALLEIKSDLSHPCVYLGDDIAVPDFCYTFGFAQGSQSGQPTTVEVEGVVDGEIQLKLGIVTFGKSGSPLLNLRTSTVCGIMRSTRDAYLPHGGRALSTAIVLASFPQIRERHDHFHAQDERWRRFASERGDLAGGLAHLPVPPKPFLAHPYAEQANFTGRVAEREMLTRWLADPGKPVMTLTAIGGMGKSALTWFWLNRDVLAREHRFEGIVWWSFYETNAKFDVFALNALAYTRRFNVATIFGGSYERMRALLTILAQHRYLIIFDGYERETIAYSSAMAAYQGDTLRASNAARHIGASNDPNASHFLRGIAADRGGSKLLITSRLFPNDLAGADARPLAGCAHVDLTGMHPSDVVTFFQAQGVSGAPEQIDGLARRYDYHPLSLRLLTGMIANDLWAPGDIAVAEKGIAARSLVSREHHILEIAYDALSESARQLLSRIAAFQAPMTRDALTTLNTFGSDEALDSLLRELIDRGFVWRDRRSLRFDLHPIVRGYAYDRLTDKGGVHTNAKKYFASIPAPNADRVQSIEDLASVFELYHHTVKSGAHGEAYELLKNRITEPVYYTLGATRDYLVLVEALWSALPLTDNIATLPAWKNLDKWPMYAWIMNSLAVAYSRTGQPTMASRLFEELARRDAVFPGEEQTATLTALADDLVSVGRLREAQKALQAAIDAPESGFKAARHRFAKECARLQFARLRWLLGYDDGEQIIEAAIGRFSQDAALRGIVTRDPRPIFDPDRYVAIGQRILAELRLERNPAAACELADSSHADATKRGIAVDLCSAEIMLGRTESALGRHDLADGLIASAIVRSRNGGMMEIDVAASLALAENRLRAGLTVDIEHLLDGADDMIAAGSYALYAVDVKLLRTRLAMLRGDLVGARKLLREARKAMARVDSRRYIPGHAPAARTLAALREQLKD